MKYRVNYGTGHIAPCESKRAAIALLKSGLCGAKAWLERYEGGTADDPGMWVKVRVKL